MHIFRNKRVDMITQRLAIFAMVMIVAASNFFVQFPINAWLTLGALTYPMSFLVTELTNRQLGSQIARRVVYFGFVIGVIISVYLATPLIALASGTAFLTAQLLDIAVFNRLRQQAWWYAPFFASLLASFLDTCVFWGIAFWEEPLVLSLACGDFLIKLTMDILMLAPFRLAIRQQFAVKN